MFKIRPLLPLLAVLASPPALASLPPHAAPALAAPPASAVPDPPWQDSEAIQPEALARRIGGKDAPLILHVGPKFLFRSGHVPGAESTGSAGEPAGLKRLEARVKKVPRTREIVIYCGCCPIPDCPNIRPAYNALKARGFKNLRVLALPTDFNIDWAGKGLPVEKGK